MSNPYESGNGRRTSILGPTLKFKGELTADEDLLIQGRIEGSIKHTSSLTIGEEGHVKADIEAEYIAVEGKVQGDLRGSSSVLVNNSANVEGNIVAPTVSLVEGATFNGTIEMSDPAEVKAQTPPAAAKSKDAKTRDTNDSASESTDKKSSQSGKKSASAA